MDHGQLLGRLVWLKQELAALRPVNEQCSDSMLPFVT